MKKRLKDVCLISGKSNRKNYGKTCTFLPMEKIYSGSYSSDLKISYGEENKGYTYIRNGEVIRAIVTPCFENLKGAYVDNLKEGFAIGSTEVMTLSPSKINPKILYYIIMSQGFIDFCLQHMKGVGGLKRINPKKSLEYPVNKAVLCEQDRIINFLDGQCDKIDTEISLLEKKSKLLEEYKQALIFETVTKGLDKNAKMKDSEVEWMGEIPENWRIKPLKRIFKERSSKNKNKDTYITNNILSVMKDIGVINYRDKGNVGNKMSEDISNYKLVYPRDIVINKMNAKIGSLGISKEFGALSVVYLILKEGSQNNEYYNYLFKSRGWQAYLRTISTGILEIRESFNNASFMSQPLPIPSKEEQNLIVDFLDEKTKKINCNISLINKKIELLKEYKQSLIHEAVTGQLEI